MSIGVMAGIALVVGTILLVGLLSGRQVKDSNDFLAGGGRAGTLLVAGTIMSSLVGSQATIGTAQLSFQFGFSGWWFTLGCGFGCFALGLVYGKKLRQSACITELQIITEEYGPAAGTLGSVLCSLGIFISVLSQLIAGAGLLSSLFPAVSFPLGALLSALLMGLYVIFGGAWGAGMGGIVKLLLLCVASFCGLGVILAWSGGPMGLWTQMRDLLAGTDLGSIQQQASGLGDIVREGDLARRYLSLTARGVYKDLSSGLSLLLGVLSTQSYAQAIWSARSDRAARNGALISGVAAPLIGLGGIAVGMFMRAHYLLPGEAEALSAAGKALPALPVLESTIRAMPVFALRHLPPLAAGVMLGTLLITLVSGGAGLVFAMATIVTRDILRPLSPRWADPKRELLAARLCILAILGAAAAMAISMSDSIINDFGFLSMGLRASVLFLPMTAALWRPGRIGSRFILGAMAASAAAMMAANLLALPGDPLLWGMAVSLLLCAAGYLANKKGKPRTGFPKQA